MLSPRCERWLVTGPGKRANKREQVDAIDIVARGTVRLSTGKESRACRAHGHARSMKCGVRIFDGDHHRSRNTTKFLCNGDGFAQPYDESFAGQIRTLEFARPNRQFVEARAQ